jgi:hypothetical protein
MIAFTRDRDLGLQGCHAKNQAEHPQTKTTRKCFLIGIISVVPLSPDPRKFVDHFRLLFFYAEPSVPRTRKFEARSGSL